MKKKQFKISLKTKRYLISLTETFLVSFAGGILIQIDNLSVVGVSWAGILGLLISALKFASKSTREELLKK